MGCHKKTYTVLENKKLYDLNNDQAVRKYSWRMLYDFLLTIYFFLCIIFVRALHTTMIRQAAERERERERQTDRETERETERGKCVCV